MCDSNQTIIDECDADATSASAVPVDWTNILPQNRIKAILQENPNVSALPKPAMDLITVASGLLIRDLVKDTRHTSVGKVDDVDIHRAVSTLPQYTFLSEALREFQAEQMQASSSHLLGNRKRTNTRAFVAADATKKFKKTKTKLVDSKHSIPKLSVADSILAQETQAFLAVDNANASHLHSRIEIDEEDYD
ncbi:hypothetical protein MPSEU_000891900 [Mayamaea pseudoterrestris]|nr:hypothetical protein MPSEU_000891900 [Mayamaea pseudoterrestris]